VLAAEEDAETAADSAGLIHRAAIDIAEVVKRGGIDEGYSGHGCGEGGEGSDEETVVALLHCPQQYGDCDQPEEMRLDAEGEEQGCARSKPMPGADKAEKGDEASEDERSNLAQLIRVAERQECKGNEEGYPAGAWRAAEVSPESERGEELNCEGEGEPESFGGIEGEKAEDSEEGQGPWWVVGADRIGGGPADGALDGEQGLGGVGILMGKESARSSPVGGEVADRTGMAPGERNCGCGQREAKEKDQDGV
jgi:hypothetical protein